MEQASEEAGPALICRPAPDAGRDKPIIERELGSAARALLATRDPRIEETTYRGRKAWRVRLPVELNLIPYAADVDRIDVTVDQQTGLPLRVRETLKAGCGASFVSPASGSTGGFQRTRSRSPSRVEQRCSGPMEGSGASR